MNNKKISFSTIGGQAVLDGVMMKDGQYYSVSVRKSDGSIKTHIEHFVALSEKFSVLKLPVIRGSINFFQMLWLGNHALQISAEENFEDEKSESRFEQWLARILGNYLQEIITVFSFLVGIILSICIFMYLPTLLTQWVQSLSSQDIEPFRGLFEGIFRMFILVIYLSVISLMPDMKTLFSYHGAEHKVIACYEAGEELNVANAQSHTRFHPRCGTSFIFVMILIGIIFYSLPFFQWNGIISRVITKLAFFPILAGLGYEFIRFAGKNSNNFLVRLLSMPGLWIQRITTKEPSIEQLEVAISAVEQLISKNQILNNLT
ncbi:DUF1385 domain-containing protein [Anaerotignum sp.]|uniref:DUF1385 domain-containing protein n=1 Tax=Anaerotignum sp. TaxID=2039241 RepID=UPI00289E13D5|nr:DUF1385 domain-containing protein [Anaerotignum sp.]